MSTDQPTTRDFSARTREDSAEAEDRWLAAHVDASTATHCRGCTAHVSARFARVHGDQDGRVHACPRCVSRAELDNGAAADPDYEHRVTVTTTTLRGEDR